MHLLVLRQMIFSYVFVMAKQGTSCAPKLACNSLQGVSPAGVLSLSTIVIVHVRVQATGVTGYDMCSVSSQLAT